MNIITGINSKEPLTPSLKIILQKLQEYKSTAEIAEEMGLEFITVKQYVGQLILRGYIKREDIKDNEEREAKKMKALEELRQARSYTEIAVSMHTNNATITHYIDELIAENKVTKEEVDSLREEAQRKKVCNGSNYQMILKGLKEGKTPFELQWQVEEVEGVIQKMQKELISFGLITQEEIDLARLRRKIKEKIVDKARITSNTALKYIGLIMDKYISDKLSPEDTETLSQLLQYDPQFATTQNMLITINSFIKQRNLKSAKDFYRDMVDKIGDDEDPSKNMNQIGKILNDYERKLSEIRKATMNKHTVHETRREIQGELEI